MILHKKRDVTCTFHDYILLEVVNLLGAITVYPA